MRNGQPAAFCAGVGTESGLSIGFVTLRVEQISLHISMGLPLHGAGICEFKAW